MLRRLLWGIAGLLIVGFLGCSSSTKPTPATPTPKQPSRIDVTPPPSRSITIPVPKADWTPVSYGGDASKQAALKAALSNMTNVALVLPRKGNPAELEERVFQMVKTISPNTEIGAKGRVNADDLRLTDTVAAENGKNGRLAEDHPLSVGWLAKKKVLNGAKGVLVVRPMSVSDAVLKNLKDQKAGGCHEVLAELKEGIDGVSKQVTGFEKQASAAIGREFSRYLTTAVPFWREELEKIAEMAETGSSALKCHAAYDKLISQYEPCIKTSCGRSPHVYIRNGGTIGMPTPLQVPDECPLAGMRNYSQEILDLGERAVLEVMPTLDAAWAAEMVRIGGLAAGAEHLQNSCAPRHRRINDGALKSASASLTKYFEGLNENSLMAVWESVKGMEHVPSVGPVTVFARPKATVANPAEDAAALKNALKQVDRCSLQDDRVYQVSVIDAVSSEITFMGLFFEENLFCEGMQPR